MEARKLQTMRGEVVLNIPAKKAWEIFKTDEILSTIDPNLLASAEYLRGDGGPGSLRLFRLGPALHHYVKESTQMIEKVESGRSIAYKVIAGELRDMYDPYRVTFSFAPVPGKKEQCVAEWNAEFKPQSPAIPPPEKAKDAALQFLKSFDRVELCV